MQKFKYTIWKCVDETLYTVTALRVKSTNSVKEAKIYFDSIEQCIITYYDSDHSDEMNATYLRDISEQLFEQ